jgi:hypothetical protein
MSLTFHWFLPTTGDGRAIMGRGHSLPPADPNPGRLAGHRAAGDPPPRSRRGDPAALRASA